MVDEYHPHGIKFTSARILLVWVKTTRNVMGRPEPDVSRKEVAWSERESVDASFPFLPSDLGDVEVEFTEAGDIDWIEVSVDSGIYTESPIQVSYQDNEIHVPQLVIKFDGRTVEVRGTDESGEEFLWTPRKGEKAEAIEVFTNGNSTELLPELIGVEYDNEDTIEAVEFQPSIFEFLNESDTTRVSEFSG